MYPPTQLVFYLFALLPALLSSLCNGNDLASCVQVECPILEGASTGADCHIANQTLVAVGVTPFSVSIPVQEDFALAWTVGLQHYDNVDPTDSYQRYIERVYYLGTPPSVDFSADDLGYAGCTFYMTLPENRNVFYDRNINSLGSSSSYCQAALGNECITSLTSKLSALSGAHTLSSPESKTCSKIASDLQSDLPSSCTALDSALVHGIALTGPTAAKPLTPSQNSTTNCYPTLPKSNIVTRQFSYNISASVHVNETGPAAEGETPILSLFWSNEGGRNASIENPSVQLSCLRPIYMTTAAADSARDGEEEGGAVPTNGVSSLVRAAASAGAAVLFFYWLV